MPTSKSPPHKRGKKNPSTHECRECGGFANIYFERTYLCPQHAAEVFSKLDELNVKDKVRSHGRGTL